MKFKQIFILLFIFNISFLLGDACSAPLLGAAHSGAPGEVNCSGCHLGTINSGPGQVNYQIGQNNGFYTPNDLLTIILTMNQEEVNQFGFQTVALQNSNNANAGIFFITNPTETRLIEDDHNGSDRIYIGHTICGADTDTLGIKQWSFEWQAPDQDIGEIQFYLSSLATNHNHSTSGDNTYTQIISLFPNNTILGDLNNDGDINILDVVGLVNIILGISQDISAGDLNQDGLYNILDVVLLVDIILN